MCFWITLVNTILNTVIVIASTAKLFQTADRVLAMSEQLAQADKRFWSCAHDSANAKNLDLATRYLERLNPHAKEAIGLVRMGIANRYNIDEQDVCRHSNFSQLRATWRVSREVRPLFWPNAYPSFLREQ